MCRLNPTVEFAVNKLFGSEENKGILISFINSNEYIIIRFTLISTIV